jgi:hypothetical protein
VVATLAIILSAVAVAGGLLMVRLVFRGDWLGMAWLATGGPAAVADLIGQLFGIAAKSNE